MFSLNGPFQINFTHIKFGDEARFISPETRVSISLQKWLMGVDLPELVLVVHIMGH